MPGAAAEVGSTANNYQVLARLATGGMAEIFLARGVSTTGVERYCVLKRILRERATDVHFVRMFLDEARLAAQLQHPNVAQVYDIGKLADSYFFTMEYVHGETVRALLHRARSLRRDVPLGSVLTVVSGAAAGLHHAHERLGHDGKPLGIVHRDVSPSNLMVSYEGGVKVVDFGVAKADNRSTETRSGTVKGKIAYLSPEQCRGNPIDRRSDLFSLGIVFWEMLTTQRLYKRASDFENMSAIVNEEPAPPSSRNAAVPPELDAIVLRLLAKDPDDRFQRADELIEAIESAAVKTGTMISSAGLSRFMRELFGHRAEPWLELQDQTHEMPQDGVTVTSEPIPAELGVSVVESIDSKLGAVPDLLAPAYDDDGEQPMTAPATPSLRREPRVLPLPPGPETRPGVPALMPTRPLASTSPSASQHASPTVATRPPARQLRVGVLVGVIAGAAVLGSFAVWLAMRGGSAAPAREAVVPRDASVTVVVAADAGAHVAADAIAAPPPVAPRTPEPGEDPPEDPRTELQAALAEKRYADVIAQCKPVTPQIAVSCTIAACKQKQETQARAFLVRVPGSKRAVINICREAGVELAPRTRSVAPPPSTPIDAGVVDPCAANPMACQR
ncbi:MAG TPA: protein kinase [Kofleriaceae bacterium]|nr:protein kinase [Kofleriaceae bacterium]